MAKRKTLGKTLGTGHRPTPSHLVVQKKLDTIRKQNVARHQARQATQALKDDILRAQMQHTYQSEHDRLVGSSTQGPLRQHALLRLAELKTLLRK